MRVLFVCTGNICRSPLAEGILRKKLHLLKIEAEVASAGFESFHEGDTADDRAIKTARNHGTDISTHIARLFTSADFRNYERIYIMDDSHHYRIRQFAKNPGDMDKVDFLMNLINPGENRPVEDPWYDDMPAFERVYQKLDKACGILAEQIASGKTR